MSSVAQQQANEESSRAREWEQTVLHDVKGVTTTMGVSKGQNRDARAVARIERAIQLRRLGATYQQIAAQCGYASRGSAYNAVAKALRRVVAEEVATLRELESERLDDLWRVTIVRALNGNVLAVGMCLRIMERRARLWGLDTPVVTQVDMRHAGVVEMHSAVMHVAGILDRALEGEPEIVRERIHAAILAASEAAGVEQDHDQEERST